MRSEDVEGERRRVSSFAKNQPMDAQSMAALSQKEEVDEVWLRLVLLKYRELSSRMSRKRIGCGYRSGITRVMT